MASASNHMLRLVEHGVLTHDEIAKEYGKMKAASRFLPWRLVRKQLKRWGCAIPSNL